MERWFYGLALFFNDIGYVHGSTMTVILDNALLHSSAYVICKSAT